MQLEDNSCITMSPVMLRIWCAARLVPGKTANAGHDATDTSLPQWNITMGKHPLYGYVVHTTKYRALMLAKSSDPYASAGGKDKDTGIVSTVGD